MITHYPAREETRLTRRRYGQGRAMRAACEAAGLNPAITRRHLAASYVAHLEGRALMWPMRG